MNDSGMSIWVGDCFVVVVIVVKIGRNIIMIGVLLRKVLRMVMMNRIGIIVYLVWFFVKCMMVLVGVFRVLV